MVSLARPAEEFWTALQPDGMFRANFQAQAEGQLERAAHRFVGQVVHGLVPQQHGQRMVNRVDMVGDAQPGQRIDRRVILKLEGQHGQVLQITAHGIGVGQQQQVVGAGRRLPEKTSLSERRPDLASVQQAGDPHPAHIVG